MWARWSRAPRGRRPEGAARRECPAARRAALEFVEKLLTKLRPTERLLPNSSEEQQGAASTATVHTLNQSIHIGPVRVSLGWALSAQALLAIRTFRGDLRQRVHISLTRFQVSAIRAAGPVGAPCGRLLGPS